MIYLEVAAWVLGGFGVAGTLIPFLRYDDWWIRGFDYPRVQLCVIMAAAVGLLLADTYWGEASHWILTAAVSGALMYQIAKILPYTPVWRKQVKDATPEADLATSSVKNEHPTVRLLMSNVLQSNERYKDLIDLVQEHDPDLLLTLETNGEWEQFLNPALAASFPHAIRVPRENRYGMHLFSRLELRGEQINHHVNDEQPSIYTEIRLTDDTWLRLYGVHPSVASPTEEDSSTERDGELAIVARKVERAGNERTIVAGDLNDVAWSHGTRLFQRISGLLDPRRGRGFYATFHADYWFARWPLDHVFHSPDFKLVKLARLPHIGSDHFPILVELAYVGSTDNEQKGLEKESDDEENADRSIKMAKSNKNDTLLVD